MSGKVISHDGERERCPIDGKNRRLSRQEIAEIRHGVDVANSQAKREGKVPKGAKITRFSCNCNCFLVQVD